MTEYSEKIKEISPSVAAKAAPTRKRLKVKAIKRENMSERFRIFSLPNYLIVAGKSNEGNGGIIIKTTCKATLNGLLSFY